MNELGLTPYTKRSVHYLGLRELCGSSTKIYSIVYGDNQFDLSKFEPGLDLASQEIPGADESQGRLGISIAILHQGRTADYLTVAWWDRENELPTRVYLLDDGQWQPARLNESFCVWDMDVIWFERCAYVEKVLCPTGASRSAYLQTHFIAQ